MNHLFKLLLLISISNGCLAKTTIFENVDNLNFVKEHAKLDKINKDSTLIIFDIDDTLLESTNFVGSGKWYDWQRGRVVQDKQGKPFNIQKEQQFLCIFRTLGTLFEMGSTKLTQSDAAQILNEFKSYDLMILTSRTTKYRDATERELSKNGIILKDKHLLKTNAILNFDLDDNNRQAKVTYANGIVMSSGLNKGMVLRTVLERLNKEYQDIYFVDDSEKNIVNMQKEWQNDNLQINIFHYTKVDKSISKKEIEHSDNAKKQFDDFLNAAYPDSFDRFQNSQCI
jgi:FMN phosphatase YigB (HAD superfamily)